MRGSLLSSMASRVEFQGKGVAARAKYPFGWVKVEKCFLWVYWCSDLMQKSVGSGGRGGGGMLVRLIGSRHCNKYQQKLLVGVIQVAPW